VHHSNTLFRTQAPPAQPAAAIKCMGCAPLCGSVWHCGVWCVHGAVDPRPVGGFAGSQSSTFSRTARAPVTITEPHVLPSPLRYELITIIANELFDNSCSFPSLHPWLPTLPLHACCGDLISCFQTHHASGNPDSDQQTTCRAYDARSFGWMRPLRCNASTLPLWCSMLRTPSLPCF